MTNIKAHYKYWNTFIGRLDHQCVGSFGAATFMDNLENSIAGLTDAEGIATGMLVINLHPEMLGVQSGKVITLQYPAMPH